MPDTAAIQRTPFRIAAGLVIGLTAGLALSPARAQSGEERYRGPHRCLAASFTCKADWQRFYRDHDGPFHFA